MYLFTTLVQLHNILNQIFVVWPLGEFPGPSQSHGPAFVNSVEWM
jgi:hypothetical protein